jgi:hypothetical protein
MLFGELDLLRLLRSDRAGTNQDESQKRREQNTQKPPDDFELVTCRFSISIIACTPQFWPGHDVNRTNTDIDCKVVVRLGVTAQREQFFALIARHPHGTPNRGRDVCLRMSSATRRRRASKRTRVCRYSVSRSAYALWPPLRLWPSSRARHFKNTARRLLSRRAYFNSMRRGSEFGRQVAVDFQSDADFHECRSGPVHSHLPTLHICQQPRLGHIRSQDGAHGSDLNQASTSFLAWSLARP